MFYPLGGFVVLVNLLLVGVERFTEDSLTSWHNYDSAAGLVITLIRVGLFGYFIQSLKDTLNHKSTKRQLRQFLIHFGMLGTLYFLTFPLLVMINVLVAPYLQHKVMTIGNSICQMVGIWCLSIIFTSKQSEYYKVSFKNQSLLPTGF